jgi:hypothetical protein
MPVPVTCITSAIHLHVIAPTMLCPRTYSSTSLMGQFSLRWSHSVYHSVHKQIWISSEHSAWRDDIFLTEIKTRTIKLLADLSSWCHPHKPNKDLPRVLTVGFSSPRTLISRRIYVVDWSISLIHISYSSQHLFSVYILPLGWNIKFHTINSTTYKYSIAVPKWDAWKKFEWFWLRLMMLSQSVI